MDPLAALFVRYAARGDAGALGEVFDRTAPRLLRLAMHVASSADDADDLVQATFVLAMRKADAFAADQPLLPWLCGILAGEAKNLARRNARRRTDELPELVSADGGPIASAERGELVARLRARVEDLPHEQRQALLLQLQHGLSPADIAEVLDVPPGTVRMRLHRGLQALRRLLPAGLAVWLFGAFPTRGLAAVRAAVMKEAGALRVTPVGGAAAVAAGVMSMKYVFAGVAALLAAALCWWLVQPTGIAPLRRDARDGANMVAANSAADTGRAPTADRTQVSTTTTGEPRDDAGALRVHVVTKEGELPLRDVALRAWPGEQSLPLDDPSNRGVRTDDAGLARFEGLQPGPWRLLAMGFGANESIVTIAAGSATENTILLPAHVVRGIVVDETGAPVAGAAIRVGDDAMAVVPWQAAATAGQLDATVRVAARSAADGTFECAAGDDEALAAAAKPGFRSSRAQPTNAPGVDSLRLVLLPRATSLRGVVLDRRRRPIASALVAARVFAAMERARDGTWSGAPLAEFARTDAAGRFEFDALPPGPTPLDASAPGYTSTYAFATIAADGATDDVEIVLVPAIQITGLVRTVDGSPVLDTVVDAMREVPGTRQRATLRTSPVQRDGRFVFARLPAPPFELVVRGNANGALLRHTVGATDERSLHVDLVLPARPTLRGRVIDEADRPLAQWSVVVRDDASKYEAWTKTDEHGAFTVQHVSGERVRVSTWWRLAPSEETELADVSPLAGEIVLRVPADRLSRAGISGRLVDHTGQPIADARVLLADANELATPHGAAVDTNGTFRMRGIAAGTYTLALKIGETTPRRLRSVTLAATESLNLGDVRVLPMATLRVEVARADGTPWHGWLPGVSVVRVGNDHGAWLPTVANGVLEGQVEPGAARLAISDPDLIAEEQEVELLPGERRVVRLAVDIGRHVSLVFAGDGDYEVAKIDAGDRLHVEVIDKSGAVVRRGEWRRSPHGDGNWTFEHTFAFGEYTVTARTDSGRRYRGSFAAIDTMPQRTITIARQP